MKTLKDECLNFISIISEEEMKYNYKLRSKVIKFQEMIGNYYGSTKRPRNNNILKYIDRDLMLKA